MKNNILKISLIILFLLFILTINSFAVCNVNVNYNYSSSNITYLKQCFNVAMEYLKENNISKEYFFIFNQASDESKIITNFDADNGTGSSDGNFFYIGFSNNPCLSTKYNYCFNGGDLIMFNFACGETFYGGENTVFKDVYISEKTRDAFNNLKIYFTNYNGGNICNIYNPYNFDSISKYTYEITLSTTEKTNNPITAYTNYFNYEDALKYECYISTDFQNWELMNYETLTDTTTNTTNFRFNYVILKNGTYYFKLYNKETQEEEYITQTITNILINSSDPSYNSKGIPQPFITYERIGEYFILKTQSFTEQEIFNYKCLYTNSFSEDFNTWSEMNIGSLQNTNLNQIEYDFFISVPKDSEDCIYYFVFYDYKKQEYSSISSLDCKFNNMNEYSDKVEGVVINQKNRFEELLTFFQDRFGFLTFPFEFIGDFLNRILNIEYSEPIIKIPELYIPGTDNLIFSGYEYNFNTLLENKALSNIYNIYLIAVDFFIVFGVVVLAKNTLMEVFGNG